jgi:hypothetical protein
VKWRLFPDGPIIGVFPLWAIAILAIAFLPSSGCAPSGNVCGESVCGSDEVCSNEKCLRPCNADNDCISSNNEACVSGLCQVSDSTGGGVTDAGSPSDAGESSDAGMAPDAGSGFDAGPASDAGSRFDAGFSTDAGNMGSADDGGAPSADGGVGPGDSGTNPDAGTGGDSGAGSAGDAGLDSGSLSGMDGGIVIMPDSGVDSGVDSGIDSGVDSGGGPDSGPRKDAGLGGGIDSGADSGVDSGPPDSGCPTFSPSWWNMDYGHRIPLSIGSVPDKGTVELALSVSDTTALQNLKDGVGTDEIRVVHHGGFANQEIDRIVIIKSNGESIIRFKVVENGGIPASSSAYYLYVGNASFPAAPKDPNNVYAYYENFDGKDTSTDPAIEYDLEPSTGWSYVTGEGKGISIRPPTGTARATMAFPLTSEPQDGFASVQGKVIGDDLWDIIGPVARMTDQTQGSLDCITMRMCQDCGANDVGVTQYINGNFNNYDADTYTFNDNTWYLLEGRFHGNTASLNVDHSIVATWNNAPEETGRVGFYVFQSDVVVDEVIFAYGMEPNIASANFNAVQDRCP